MILPGVALFDEPATGSPDVAAQAERTPPKAILLLRYGKTSYTKGEERSDYEFTPDDADKVLSDFETRKRDIVIDYEHQTLQTGKAPAAGWIEALSKTAEGIMASVRYWTKEARRYLEEGEYRYFSPVLNMSKRRPLSLHSVALTNHPATHGLPALVANDEADTGIETAHDLTQETHRMENLTKLAETLGLQVALTDGKPDEAATLAAITGRIAELQGAVAGRDEFLKLHDCPDLGAVTGKIKGMVPQAELTVLTDRLACIDAEKAVAAAFAERKLTEAQRDWAVGYAKSNPQGFADFVSRAPAAVPAPAAVVTAALKDTAEDPLALSDESLARAFKSDPRLVAEGFTEKSYAAFRRAEAAGRVKVLRTAKTDQE